MPPTADLAAPVAQPVADAERADGDIRYRPDIQGCNREIRGRVREAEHQVYLLVTARIRDNNTAAQELLPETLQLGMDRIAVVAELFNRGYAGKEDVRAEFASLAATAIICAEACDRPYEIGGMRLLRANGQKQLRVA